MFSVFDMNNHYTAEDQRPADSQQQVSAFVMFVKLTDEHPQSIEDLTCFLLMDYL